MNNKKKKVDIYVCSKPLQFVNAKAIASMQMTSNDKILYIIPSFKDATDFVERVKYNDDTWKEIYVKKSFVVILSSVFLSNVENLYVHTDMSINLGIFSKLKKCNIYVYEEGCGSYTSQNWRKKGFVYRVFDRFLGVGEQLTSSKFLAGAFLYFPQLLMLMRPQNKVLLNRIQPSFLDGIALNMPILCDISRFDSEKDLQVRGKKILLYITEWQMDRDILKYIEENSSEYDYVYIKPHPHIRKSISLGKINCKVLEVDVMAEIIINRLLQQGNDLTVIHNCSTSVLYFLGHIQEKRYFAHDSFDAENAKEYDFIAKYITRVNLENL